MRVDLGAIRDYFEGGALHGVGAGAAPAESAGVGQAASIGGLSVPQALDHRRPGDQACGGGAAEHRWGRGPGDGGRRAGKCVGRNGLGGHGRARHDGRCRFSGPPHRDGPPAIRWLADSLRLGPRSARSRQSYGAGVMR